MSNPVSTTLQGGWDENPDRLASPLLTSTFTPCRRGDLNPSPRPVTVESPWSELSSQYRLVKPDDDTRMRGSFLRGLDA